MTPLPAARPSAFTTIGEGMIFDIGARMIEVAETAVACGRNAGLAAQILGEAFRALELAPRPLTARRRGCRRLPDRRPGRRRAALPVRRRRDRSVRACRRRRPPQGRRDRARQAFGDVADAGVSRRGEELASAAARQTAPRRAHARVRPNRSEAPAFPPAFPQLALASRSFQRNINLPAGIGQGVSRQLTLRL